MLKTLDQIKELDYDFSFPYVGNLEKPEDLAKLKDICTGLLDLDHKDCEYGLGFSCDGYFYRILFRKLYIEKDNDYYMSCWLDEIETSQNILASIDEYVPDRQFEYANFRVIVKGNMVMSLNDFLLNVGERIGKWINFEETLRYSRYPVLKTTFEIQSYDIYGDIGEENLTELKIFNNQITRATSVHDVFSSEPIVVGIWPGNSNGVVWHAEDGVLTLNTPSGIYFRNGAKFVLECVDV